MATVTGLTADRMLEIEAESIVDGAVVVDHLILTRHDGTQIDAGSVRGPQGIQGPPYVNGVDTVHDQSVGGAKTFTQKARFQLAADGVAIEIGSEADLHSLDITPYGAAAVVLSSGAEFSGAASIARAASAAQIELLNGGLNFYADGGLTVGNAYARTKLLALAFDGRLALTRPTAGISLLITEESDTMGGGSLFINRSAVNKTQSIVFGLGPAYNFVIGRRENQDDLSLGVDGGSGFVEKFRLYSEGSFYASGPNNRFGGGAFGDPGVFVNLTDTSDHAVVRAGGTLADIQLDLNAKGAGSVVIHNGASDQLGVFESDGTFSTKRAADGQEIIKTIMADGGIGTTQVQIRCGLSAGSTLARLILGATNSGGFGFRSLIVPN